MALSYWRMLFISLLIILIAGCSKELQPEQHITNKGNEHQTYTATQTDPTPQEKWNTLLGDLKNISVITKEGTEINLDKQEFLEKFHQLPFVEEAKEDQYAYDYMVLFWSQTDEPAVVSLTKQGVKWENIFYRGDGATKFSDYIEVNVAKEFFKQVNANRITVISKDLDQTKQFSDQGIEELFSMLQQAQYLKGGPRIPYPLFPYYVLEMDMAGKDIIQVEVLSPTLISVGQGNEKMYYQTVDSLYTPLMTEMPITNYSEHSFNHLFKATALQVHDYTREIAQVYDLKLEEMTELEVQSTIHQVVRTLKGGERAVSSKPNSPVYKLVFAVEKEKILIDVYEDGFIYQGQFYKKSNVINGINQMLGNEGIFQKKP
ncbi:hypothetical protein [Ammoniphilus resinae]|uniref:Lipoprotein n=1 Tax=Ammoniphilus resinae TaxID=861532 RepID=A0ABS4GKK5_9BACL|nr:hypothetical protein [Ammoniphilus resinae]MBP1930774.1 hypothetical protein [Ammoniphilus resinae]